MCLYVKEGEDVRIADKPITVYKAVKKYFFGLLATPPYFDSFTYKRFIRHKLGFGLQIEPDYLSDNRLVRKGFHAYTKALSAESELISTHNLSIVKMTIPVGAEYVLGEYEEIVSNQLVWN